MLTYAWVCSALLVCASLEIALAIHFSEILKQLPAKGAVFLSLFSRAGNIIVSFGRKFIIFIIFALQSGSVALGFRGDGAEKLNECSGKARRGILKRCITSFYIKEKEETDGRSKKSCLHDARFWLPSRLMGKNKKKIIYKFRTAIGLRPLRWAFGSKNRNRLAQKRI